ncbi:DUF3857 domain-containing protein [Aestuariibacter sp. A3R04]|uniref:DUF3857 domain-containing protein n=1 Tax=Aestuariibacter sp. A3R04 TaxID=2841571 RepID=UPI001C0A29A2|nr:DUF3857 domain-containing protein [Aestuariibacter sp. A3R04]MBU3023295.1 DUF3857 and transglutaminase domain-containing protein [Aestuariibacter sp. A3R04]
MINKRLVWVALVFYGLHAHVCAMQQDPSLVNDAIARMAALKTKPDSLTSLLTKTDIHVGRDKVVTTVTDIWYYPTKTLVQDSGYESIYFRQGFELLEVVSAASVSPAGAVRWAEDKHVKILDTDAYNSFSDTKQVVVSYPGLEEGGVTVIKYTVEESLAALEGVWSYISYPQRHADFLSYHFSISWEDASPVYHSVNSEFVHCDQDNRRVVCTGENIPPVHTDDVVEWDDELGSVTVSTINSWDRVRQVIAKGFKQAQTSVPDIRQQVVQLTKYDETIEQKIASVFSFVAQDIRYVSMSEADHAYVPHSAASTLAERYGDCKDKTSLLIAMLSELGITAEPVLVNTDRMSVENVLLPAVTLFDHVVACFALDGSQYCLDPTDVSTAWEQVSDWIQNKVSLPLYSDSSLTNLHADTYRYKLTVTSTITLTEDGGQREDQIVEYGGEYESEIRDSLLGKSEDEREEWGIELYEDVVGSGDETSVVFTGSDQLSAGLSSQTQSVFPSYFDPSQEIDLQEIDAWISYELGTIDNNNSEYAHFFPGSKVVTTYSFQWPAAWDINLYPGSLNLQHELGHYTRSVSRGEVVDGMASMIVVSEMAIPAGWISAKQNKMLQQLVAKFKAQTPMFIGRKK